VNGLDWHHVHAPLVDEGAVESALAPDEPHLRLREPCLGNTLAFTNVPRGPASVMDRLREVRPSVFMSVPSGVEKLAQKAVDGARFAEATGGRLHFCLSGGAGLKREVKELFHAHGTLIIEGLRPHETSPTLTLTPPDGSASTRRQAAASVE